MQFIADWEQFSELVHPIPLRHIPMHRNKSFKGKQRKWKNKSHIHLHQQSSRNSN